MWACWISKHSLSSAVLEEDALKDVGLDVIHQGLNGNLLLERRVFQEVLDEGDSPTASLSCFILEIVTPHNRLVLCRIILWNKVLKVLGPWKSVYFISIFFLVR